MTGALQPCSMAIVRSSKTVLFSHEVIEQIDVVLPPGDRLKPSLVCLNPIQLEPGVLGFRKHIRDYEKIILVIIDQQHANSVSHLDLPGAKLPTRSRKPLDIDRLSSYSNL